MKSFILLILIPINTFAHIDFDYGVSARSYPSIGGSVDAELGYSQLLWGDTSSPLFGMIRPSVSGSTSAVVYETDSKLTLYPISFIGFGAGQKKVTSEYKEFTYFDCDKVRCEGEMIKDYSFAKMALAYGPLLTTFTYTEFRNSYNDPKDQSRPVGEYTYIIEANPKNEEMVQRQYFLGYKFNEDILGILSEENQFIRSHKNQKLNLVILNQKFENLSVIYGIGSLQSSDIKPGVIGVLKITHTLSKSLALF